MSLHPCYISLLCSQFLHTFSVTSIEFLEWIRCDAESVSLEGFSLCLFPSNCYCCYMSTSQAFLSWLSFLVFRSFSKKSGKMLSSVFLPYRQTKVQNDGVFPADFATWNNIFHSIYGSFPPEIPDRSWSLLKFSLLWLCTVVDYWDKI